MPAVTYSHAIPPLLRRADVVTAQRYHRIGFPPVKRLRKEGIASLSEHLLFTAVTHDLGRGLRLLRESLPLAGDHPAAVQATLPGRGLSRWWPAWRRSKSG